MKNALYFQIRSNIYRIYVSFLVALITAISYSSLYASPETALDDYINSGDGYNYSVVNQIPGANYIIYLVYMYSQQWRSPGEVDRPLWSHWMGIIIPNQVTKNTGMLIISGGNNDDLPDPSSSEVIAGAQIAVTSESVVTVLGQVPNQPLSFTDEPYPHSEDHLVAYSFDKFMNTGDPFWPVYLPMTKAAVKAMDTVQSIVTPLISPHSVDNFVVTGFSKRGATAWLTGVVDERVLAIAPGVFDILNMDEQLEHHYSVYGFYSDALHDYSDYDIIRRIRSPEGQDLLKIVDPYSYLDRLDMPKFLINSTGDEFFVPDSARFYFDDLAGETLIRYVANTGHALETQPGDISDAVASIASWYINILDDNPRPTVTWSKQNGNLVVQTNQQPALVRFWHATNTNERDFRLETIGKAWSYTPLLPSAPGTFTAPIPTPAQGWTAYYIDLTFPGPKGIPQTYSTQVYVSPDTTPYEVIDPLGDPRGLGYWKHQVQVAVTGVGNSQISGETLQSYFPVPLFDEYIKNINAAAELYAETPGTPQIKAKQHCLSTRLNIAQKQLGWYTPLQINGFAPEKLWQLYAVAHDSYLKGDYQKSKNICEAINSL